MAHAFNDDKTRAELPEIVILTSEVTLADSSGSVMIKLPDDFAVSGSTDKIVILPATYRSHTSGNAIRSFGAPLTFNGYITTIAGNKPAISMLVKSTNSNDNNTYDLFVPVMRVDD